MTSVQAGDTEAVHKITLEWVHKQQLVEVQGQTDILTLGIPYVCPYNPDGVMNPVLVMCMGLGYLFNMYRNKPLVREGGVIIMTHPTYRDFHPVHHPSYIDFFEQVLADTTDPATMSKKWEKQYAEDEWYRHLYRTGNAYHGVHPFYAWYWGAHGLQHAGKVIIVGGDPPTVRRLGFTPASTMDDAFEIASDVVGRTPDDQPSARSRALGRRRAMASKRTVPHSMTGLRRATRVGDVASATLQRGLRPVRNVGFPYRKPERARRASSCLPDPSKLGANFETAWARRGPAKAARKVITNGPLRGLVYGLARPEVYGADRLEDLRAARRTTAR